MRTITKKLNVTPGGIPLLIRVNQYDSDFSIVFTLYSSDSSWTLESGTTAKIRGTKKSGTGYSADATVNTSTNTVTIAGDQQMTAVAGINTFEVVLYSADSLELSTANFILFCEKAAMDTDTITDETVLAEITDFETQIAAAEDAASRAEAAADSVTIDNTLTQSGKAADAKATGDEISVLKEDLTQAQTDIATAQGDIDALETAVSGKVAKPTTSPNGTDGQLLRTNGDGTTTWSNYASPTDAQVDSAVSDWLDDHPEATTTVEDGSLTVAKFTSSAQMQVLNDYVTPEMYGAVGDGTTDDTQAIKDMFASSAKKFVFLSDTYLVTGGIQVTTEDCVVDFLDKTTLQLETNNDVRDFDYVIGFFALRIKTHGQLYVNANHAVNVGIYLSQCAHSHFDYLSCNYARVWGIATDVTHQNLGSMHFGYLAATACGYKVNAVGICNTKNVMEISGITFTVSSNLSEAAIRSMLDYSNFTTPSYIIDDSNFQNNSYYTYTTNNDSYQTPGSRVAWGSRTGIVLDEDDVTKGTFTVNYGTLPTQYVSDEDSTVGRDIFIPVGGGILLKPAGSEGLCDIDKVSTMRCPIGLAYNMQYGGTIRNFASQFDTICMESIALALTIVYMYAEGVGTGYQVEDLKRVYLITQNTNPSIYVINPYVGQGRIPFFQENWIACQQVASNNMENLGPLHSPTYLAEQKLVGNNANVRVGQIITVTEYSPRTYTVKTNTYNNSTKNITLDLVDLNARHVNKFTPFTLYAYSLTNNTNTMGITLSTNLINAGYTIYGATDNVLTITPGDYNFFKTTIVLYGKVFYVTTESMSFGNAIKEYPTTSTVSSMISAALAAYENGNTASY